MYPILLISSSVDGHFNYFYLLPIVKRAAVNIVYKFFFCLFEYLFSIILGIHVGKELVGHVLILRLTC